jgi:hypothetical protein
MSHSKRARLELEILEDRSLPSAVPALPANFSNVLAVNYKPGANTIDVVVALPKGVFEAANHGANFGLDVMLMYVSVNNTVETLDSGLVSINTGLVFLNQVDNKTVVVDLNIPFGALPLPGNKLSYSPTSQVLNPAGP